MNTAPVSSSRALIALAVLLALLTACSSTSETTMPGPTTTPKMTHTPTLIPSTAMPTKTPTEMIVVKEANPTGMCVWQATAKVWMDENSNGEWDENELPLENVQLWIDRAWFAGRALSDGEGVAHLDTEMGCATYAFEVYAEAPPGYYPTTPHRINIDTNTEGPFLFGFRSLPPTPSPVSTQPPAASLRLGDVRTLEEAGFAFQPIEGYWVDLRASQATMVSPDQTILFSMATNLLSNEGTLADEMNRLLAPEDKEFAALETGEPLSITINGVEGLVTDVSGTWFGFEVTGRFAIASLGDSLFFYALASAVSEDRDQIWATEGTQVFDAVIDSVSFFEPTPVWSACFVENDATYGYTPQSPVRIGGDWLDGPPRERAFLDVLQCPDGMPVTYDRKGSIDFEDTILDVYKVRCAEPNTTVELYLDVYSYVEPMAPVDFSCAFPIPFREP